MANSVVGGQLATYNANLAYTTSTTAATQGLIVYGKSAGRAQGGITNAVTDLSNSGSTDLAYTGVTHFKNISGKDGLYLGDAGLEIPLTDKQATLIATSTNSSAANIAWIVVPFQCTIAGYITAIGGAPAAGATNVLAYTGSSASGGLIATITINTTGGPGDTYSWNTATASTAIPAGTPVSFNFNTTASGTAYQMMITAVLTRVGI